MNKHDVDFMSRFGKMSENLAYLEVNPDNTYRELEDMAEKFNSLLEFVLELINELENTNALQLEYPTYKGT